MSMLPQLLDGGGLCCLEGGGLVDPLDMYAGVKDSSYKAWGWGEHMYTGEA